MAVLPSAEKRRATYSVALAKRMFEAAATDGKVVPPYVVAFAAPSFLAIQLLFMGLSALAVHYSSWAIAIGTGGIYVLWFAPMVMSTVAYEVIGMWAVRTGADALIEAEDRMAEVAKVSVDQPPAA